MRRNQQGDRWHQDRGDLMLWVAVAAPVLVLGLLTLVSASRQWEARREAQAVAAAAARAGAQPDGAVLRRSNNLGLRHSSVAEMQLVRRRVIDVVNGEPGAVLVSVTIRHRPSPDRSSLDRSSLDRSLSVTVEVAIPTAPVVSVPGLASSVVGSATATAVEQSEHRR